MYIFKVFRLNFPDEASLSLYRDTRNISSFLDAYHFNTMELLPKHLKNSRDRLQEKKKQERKRRNHSAIYFVTRDGKLQKAQKQNHHFR